MVFCTYCGKAFSRDEHLERHILTHTNVKPYKCFMCYMSFARRDLLKRHYIIHGQDKNDSGSLSRENGVEIIFNRRSPIACHDCAKDKTKCDKQLPCSRCSKRGLKCTIRPTRRGLKGKSRVGRNRPTASNSPPDQPLPPKDQQQQKRRPLPRQRQTSQPFQQPIVSQTYQPYQTSPYTDSGNEMPVANGFPASFCFGPPRSGASPASTEGEAVSHNRAPVNIEDYMFKRGYEYLFSTTTYGPNQCTDAQFTEDWQQMPVGTGFELVPWPEMGFEMALWPDARMQYETVSSDEYASPNSALLEDSIITMMPEFFETLKPPKELL